MNLAQKLITIFNITILGLEPVVILFLLSVREGGFPDYPWWAVGIFLSWAFTVNLWVGLGSLFKKQYSPINQYGFLLFNFAVPIILAIWKKEDLWSSLYQVSSYHFLALAVAIAVTMLLAPFWEKKTSLGEKLRSVFLGGGIFIFAVTLPAFWVESLYLTDLDQASYWEITRYISMAFEAYFIFQLLKLEVAN